MIASLRRDTFRVYSERNDRNLERIIRMLPQKVVGGSWLGLLPPLPLEIDRKGRIEAQSFHLLGGAASLPWAASSRLRASSERSGEAEMLFSRFPQVFLRFGQDALRMTWENDSLGARWALESAR